MIVDCFTFFNELDLLEIRLTTLEDVVDRFVLCEAPFTFRGAPKPLHYHDHRARFARWADRIVHLVYDAVPSADPWTNEWGQRAFLTTGLAGSSPDDVILIGDVDEIPAMENAGRRPAPGRVLVHRQRIASGYFNRITGESWAGTRSLAFGDLGTRSLNDIRSLRWSEELEAVDGGWHVSSLGGAAVVAEKFGALSHVESDIPYYTDRFRLALEFASESGARWVPLDATFPAAFRDPRWSRYVWPQPDAASDVAERIRAHGCFAYVPADASTVGVVTASDTAAWAACGVERYGTAFVGAVTTVDAAVAGVPRDGWIVVDALESRSLDDLRALAVNGINVVAFAHNARSFATLEAILGGASFPAGRAAGIAELEAAIAAAGYAIERRDGVVTGIYFPPASLPATGSFGVEIGWLALAAVTRESLANLTAADAIFVLRPR